MKEVEIILEFALDEGYISKTEYAHAASLANEIGAMLWRTMNAKKDNDF